MTAPLFHESLLICECCGESSPTRFMHELNHYLDPGGECRSARLRRRHVEVRELP
ncbi:hypothetical protein CAURIC_08140 [Corynebacterium auriscanis]|nr:hypothetical protein CAURIC_08140 [Corynebacterium auriscanis]